MFSSLRKRLFATESPGEVALLRHPLYVFSLHKSGTHLLKSVLNGLGLKTYACPGAPDLSASMQAPVNSYIGTNHRLPCDDVRIACAQGAARIILNIRDPRDIFLSTIDYFDWSRKPTAFGHVNFYRDAYSRAFRDRDELAEAVLNDFTLGDYPYTISSQLNSCLVLRHHPSVLSVRYEDLHAFSSPKCELGSEHPVCRICQYLSIDMPPDANKIIGNSIQMGSRTMNVGRPGRWRTDLSPALLKAFENKHALAIRLLGY